MNVPILHFVYKINLILFFNFIIIIQTFIFGGLAQRETPLPKFHTHPAQGWDSVDSHIDWRRKIGSVAHQLEAVQFFSGGGGGHGVVLYMYGYILNHAPEGRGKFSHQGLR